jgi:serine phosphatase RsbU (regulator of sigma subunit)
MLFNPDSGRLRIMAAIGLPEHVIGLDVSPRARSISDWVYRNRRGVIVNGVVKDQRFEGSAERVLESAMSVPILIDHYAIGVLNLARVSDASTYEECDIARATAMLPSVATTLYTVRDRAQAERNQVRMRAAALGQPASRIPRGLSDVRNYQIAYAHVPGIRLGADLCDRLPHPSGGHSVIVADVTGHGPSALALSNLVQGLFVGLASSDRGPMEILTRIGAEIYTRFEGRAYAALWIALLSPSGQLQYCNAGYPAPLWIAAEDGDVHPLASGGTVAGALPGASYEQETLRLLPGDTLVVASDGIYEARDGGELSFGQRRVMERLGEQHRLPIEQLVDSLCQEAHMFSAHGAPFDDLAALALRYTRES